MPAADLGSIERTLSEIWAEVLAVEHVGADDDFFRLGGSSLAAIQLAARCSAAFGVTLTPATVFQARTVSAFAQAVAAGGDGAPSASAPRRGRRRDRLSPLQASVWAARLQGPDPTPHGGGAFLLEGTLDVAALEWAFGELVRRHEILRTTVATVDYRPVARVLAPAPFRIPVVDLTGRRRRERDAELQRRIQETHLASFDLAAAGSLRVELVRLGARAHALIVVFHEFACDGEGFGPLLDDLSRLYDARVAGAGDPFDAPALQYADVFDDAGPDGGREGDAYWRRVLVDLPLALPIPFETGGRPGAVRSTKGTSLQVQASVHERLMALARPEAATAFTAYLATFVLLLQRRSGDERIVVSSPAANRMRPELQRVVGFFARVIPLRIDVEDDPSFRTLLRRTRDTVLATFRYAERLPTDDRARHLAGVRSVQMGLPRFRLLEETLDPKPALGDVRVTPLPMGGGEGGQLVMHVRSDRAGPTVVELLSDATELARAELARMLRHWRDLLEAVLEQPDLPLSAIATSPAPARAAAPAAAAPRLLHELVADQAQRAPGAVALLRPDGGTLTYGELHARAARLARRLRARGAGAGTTVGFALRPSDELLVALLAALRTGALCVAGSGGGALAPVDLLVQGRDAPPASAATVVELDADEPAIAASAGADEPAPPGPDDAALRIGTAGTTGPPQPVTIAHATLAAAAARARAAYRLTSQDAVQLADGPGALAWAAAALPFLACGVALVAAPADTATGRLDERATVAALPPAAAERVLARGAAGAGALRLLLVRGHGALRLPPDGRRPQLELLREYAVAEAGGVVLGEPVARSTERWEGVRGRPREDAGVAVLDAHGRLAPTDVVGELHVDCARRPRGTGDLARRLEDGTVEFFGRAGDEVRVRGFRFNPSMSRLEAALEQHPAVLAALACWDAASASLVVQLVAGRAQLPTARELDRWARERMSEAFLPARYVAVDALPLRADGSPDRSAPLAGRPLEHAVCDRRVAKELTRIWRKVLGQRRIGPHDDFFLLGGDLVRALEVAWRARDAGLDVVPGHLGLAPTIALLTEVLAEDAT